jgi:sortase A
MRSAPRLGLAVLLVVALAGCDAAPTATGERTARDPEAGVVATTPAGGPSSRSAQPSADPDPEPSGPRPSDGRPRDARLSIPALGVRDLEVVAYRGFTDDAPGTVIQDGGVAASPFGPRGGEGPGGIGNYQVTAHRTSSTRAFEFLPGLRAGERVFVDVGRRRYVYEISTTRRTSFREPRSLAEQRAAVPGRPGRRATEAMITLSTCATREDHAAGNYWSDEFHNPEHRIDKIGVLVASRRR